MAATAPSRSPCAVPAWSAYGRRCCLPGAVMPSRSMSARRALRRCVQSLCRRHARAALRGGKRRGRHQRARQTRHRAVAGDLSRHQGQRHAGRGAPSRPRRARPLRPHDRAGTGGCRRPSLPRSSRLSPIASPARCSTRRKPISRRTARCASCSTACNRGRRGRAPRRRRDAAEAPISSSIAGVSPPRTISRRCAACAASGLSSGAARSI